MFITFEGPEGSGKTTQIKRLEQALFAVGYSVITTREPGGTAIGEQVRAILLDKANGCLTARAEALLFNAARAQLVAQVIDPAIAAGQIVLCDRYTDSTLAYQGYGRGESIPALRSVADYAAGGRVPDLTILLDLDPAVGLARKAAADEVNRLDSEALEFHKRVRSGYTRLVVMDPRRFVVIDADQDPAVVFDAVWSFVRVALEARGRWMPAARPTEPATA